LTAIAIRLRTRDGPLDAILPSPTTRKTALVVSAHSADFVWRAGGAIALHAEQGYAVTARVGRQHARAWAGRRGRGHGRRAGPDARTGLASGQCQGQCADAE